MSIEKTLIDYYKSTFDVKVTSNTMLIEEGLIDSMGVTELLTFLGEKYDIEFDIDDMTIENLGAISTIVRLVESKKGAN